MLLNNKVHQKEGSHANIYFYTTHSIRIQSIRIYIEENNLRSIACSYCTQYTHEEVLYITCIYVNYTLLKLR